MDSTSIAATCVAIALAIGPATSQEILWERSGIPNQSRFGGPSALLGDLNGDGFPEVLHHVNDDVLFEQQLWVLSGADGTTLRKIRPPFLESFGAPCSAGDADGDGVMDYGVVLINEIALTEAVEVRSGVDDRVIWSVSGTWQDGFRDLLGDLDLDADGKPDLVVTATNRPGSEVVSAYSCGGTLLYRLPGSQEFGMGWHGSYNVLAHMGDFDNDGADDFVVGGGGDPRGGAAVISGRTGKAIIVGHGPQWGDNVGWSVAGCGDLDGDGIPEFAAGNRAIFRRGLVVVFSGATGKPMYEWSSEQFLLGFEGEAVSSGIDVDRDGISDVIVGAPMAGPNGFFGGDVGTIFAFSGRDGSVMHRFINRTGPQTKLGLYTTALGAWPGSPYGVYATSETSYTGPAGNIGSAKGRLVVFRGNPPGAEAYGSTCQGSLSAAPKIGLRPIEDFGTRVMLHDAPPGASAVLLLGTSRTSFAGLSLPASLTGLGYTNCSLWTSIEVPVPVTVGSDGIGAGYAAVDFSVPPAPLGNPVHAQWLVIGEGETAPGALSDAVLFRVP